MVKTIKKILLGSASVLGVSTLFWIVLLVNPKLSYANQTQFGQITVHHNQALDAGTETVINDAKALIKNASIYDDKFSIDLCLNDDLIYPKLHPIPGGSAYAFLNKTVIYASTPQFNENIAEFKWEINNNELRAYNLTYLIAHEFMHNLQHHFDAIHYAKNSFGQINWKFEGHAEYIARAFKNDGLLKEKINFYLIEATKDHVGVPVFKLEDGTIQNLAYFKYALVVQYLTEEQNLSYKEICDLDSKLDKY